MSSIKIGMRDAIITACRTVAALRDVRPGPVKNAAERQIQPFAHVSLIRVDYEGADNPDAHRYPSATYEIWIFAKNPNDWETDLDGIVSSIHAALAVDETLGVSGCYDTRIMSEEIGPMNDNMGCCILTVRCDFTHRFGQPG